MITRIMGVKTMINDIQREIILQKCQEREAAGYQTIHDSDIHDIIEECQRRGVPLSRKEFDALFTDDVGCIHCNPNSDKCEYFRDVEWYHEWYLDKSDDYKRVYGVSFCEWCGRELGK